MFIIWLQIWLRDIAVESTWMYSWLPVRRKGTGNLLTYFKLDCSLNFLPKIFKCGVFFLPVTKFNLDSWMSHLPIFPPKVPPVWLFRCSTLMNWRLFLRGCLMWKILGGSHWKIVILVSFGAIKIKNVFECQISFRYVAILVEKFGQNWLLNGHDGSQLTFLRVDQLLS